MSVTPPVTTSRPAPSPPSHRRPRLLLVGPRPPAIGGVESFIQALVESRALAGFEVATCDTGKTRPKETQGRFDAGNFVWAARHISRMLRVTARFHPEVVYLPVSGTWAGFLRDMALAWIARRSGARVVGHVHGSDFHFLLERRGLDRALARAGLGQLDRMMVLGRPWVPILRDAGVRCPVEVVPSTFREEVFERGAATPARRPEGDGVVRGLLVGQIGRRKGVFDLLRAVARLKTEGLPFHLQFVGFGEFAGEWDEAQALRRELGLEAMTEFSGPLEGEALHRCFARADLFLMPSYTEGLPIVLFEAGAFSLPVITSPVGAIPELIVDQRNGLLVAPGDVAAIAAAIARLARDREARERMGAALRQDIMAFHPDRVSERVARELMTALDPAAARDTEARA